MSREESTGLGEGKQSRFDNGSAGQPPKRERVKLGEGGRFVIPAAMRLAMGVQPGDQLIMHVVDGELRVRNWRDALRRIQDKTSKLAAPQESAVDEFLRERQEDDRLSQKRLDRLHREGSAPQGGRDE